MILHQKKPAGTESVRPSASLGRTSWSVEIIEDLKQLTEKSRRKVLKIIKEIIRTLQPAEQIRRPESAKGLACATWFQAHLNFCTLLGYLINTLLQRVNSAYSDLSFCFSAARTERVLRKKRT
jgi:hypothetical protein